MQKNEEGMLFVVPASMPEKQFSKQRFQLVYFEILQESQLNFAKSTNPAQNVAPKPDLLGKAGLLVTSYTAVYLSSTSRFLQCPSKTS